MDYDMKGVSGIVFKGKHLLLLCIPFFYLVAGLYFRLILEDPSLRSVDPDYVYFMTGLNMSEGVLRVYHIDHPGTPLQYLIALVFKMTWWLRGNPNGFVADVLMNPDLYLSMVNLAINLLVATTLFFAGWTVFRKTGSVIYGLLLQTIPLIPVILYEIIGRITPEQILALPVIGLTALLIIHTSGKKQDFSTSEKVLLALIIGFGLSIKLTLIPLVVIPLIILRKWSSKIMVLALTVVFFLLFALPATLQFERFWQWTKDLFLHSGQYGTGEANIIDLKLFGENFSQMIRLEIHFSVIYLVLALLAGVILVWFRKRRDTGIYQKAVLALAVIAVVILQAVMSGKHYAPRYFMPALMFGPLMVYLIIEIFSELYPVKLFRNVLMVILSLFIFWSLSRQAGVIRYTSEAFESQIKARKMTRNVIQTLEENSIKVIVTQDYGSPFPEYALHFATAWSEPNLKPHYLEILGKLYPSTYQYNPWDGKFTFWGKPFDPAEISAKGLPVYLYLEKNSEELYNKTLEKLYEAGKPFKAEKKAIYINPVNGESIFRLLISFPEESTGIPSTNQTGV